MIGFAQRAKGGVKPLGDDQEQVWRQKTGSWRVRRGRGRKGKAEAPDAAGGDEGAGAGTSAAADGAGAGAGSSRKAKRFSILRYVPHGVASQCMHTISMMDEGAHIGEEWCMPIRRTCWSCQVGSCYYG